MRGIYIPHDPVGSCKITLSTLLSAGRSFPPPAGPPPPAPARDELKHWKCSTERVQKGPQGLLRWGSWNEGGWLSWGVRNPKSPTQFTQETGRAGNLLFWGRKSSCGGGLGAPFRVGASSSWQAPGGPERPVEWWELPFPLGIIMAGAGHPRHSM